MATGTKRTLILNGDPPIALEVIELASGRYALSTAEQGSSGGGSSSGAATIADGADITQGAIADTAVAAGAAGSLSAKLRAISRDVAAASRKGSGTHNTLEPNHEPGFTRAITLKALGAQTIGTSGTDVVAHNLGYTPTEVVIVMTSAGTIWESAAAGGTNITLTADAAGRTAKIYAR